VPALSGRAAGALPTITYFAAFPNALVSLHPDYLMLHTLWPRQPGHTEIVCEFFFEPETMARPEFDPSDAIEFWDQVNREDWHVCELTQKGMSSQRRHAERAAPAGRRSPGRVNRPR
jgi:Rieske 2Fe-2S family protein